MSNAILSIMCDVYKLESTTVSDMLTAFFCPHYDMKHASIKTQKKHSTINSAKYSPIQQYLHEHDFSHDNSVVYIKIIMVKRHITSIFYFQT